MPDPLITPEMAAWLEQKRAELQGAYASDKEAQTGEDRKALLMQFAQSFANRRPTQIAPRKVGDAKEQFGAMAGLEDKAVGHSIAARNKFDPLLDLRRQKLEGEVAKLRGTGEDALEPELVTRAKKVAVPTEKRKREAVIADILAAEKATADRSASVTKEKATAEAKAKELGAKDLDDLRKEFQGLPMFKDAAQVATAYDKVQNTSDSGAGDMALIFGFMKILDPGSTVREGEYATAENVGSVPQRVATQYNKAVSGEKLAPDVRKSFKTEAKRLFDAQMVRYRKAAEEYKRLAGGRGLDPKDVVLDVGMGASPDEPPVPGAVKSKSGKWMQKNAAGQWEYL